MASNAAERDSGGNVAGLSRASPDRRKVVLPPRLAPSEGEEEAMCSIRVLAMAMALAGAVATSAHGEPGTHYDLTAIAGPGAGIVEVAPTAHDVAGPGTFDVQGTINVHGAAPNTIFTVLRRVDPNPDGVCTGATWLNLPGSPTPVLTASAGRAGRCTSRSRGARHSSTASDLTSSGGSSAATVRSSRGTASPSR
jgi:hypothetical protein